MANVTFNLNGAPVTIDADDDEELLWVLRDRLSVLGPKYGCGIGACGACTSHMDGQAIRPCITPMAEVDGHDVVTIEGLADGPILHPVQQAWLDEDVAQCGYCQAGQIMTAVALLASNPNPTDADIDEAMSDNICRCGTYYRIRLAIKRAAGGAGFARLGGADRIDTAVVISRALFGPEEASSVLLARSDDFPDAFAGAPLGVSTIGPLLLTTTDTLHAATLAEMRRVLSAGSTVFLLGGTDALSEAVSSAVTQAGFTVQRLGGAGRQQTAATIAPIAAPSPEVIFIASGDEFADALVAGATAARQRGALLLTNVDGLDAEGQAYLDQHSGVPVVVVGSAAAGTVDIGETIAGSDQYETAVLVAERFQDGTNGVALASAESYVDALAGGVHAALAHQALLLTGKDSLPKVVSDYLVARAPANLTVYGGNAAINDTVSDQARQLIGVLTS